MTTHQDRSHPVKLQEIADSHYAQVGRRSGKPPRYFDTYEELFESKRAEPLRLLELGVKAGGSARIWREYFPNATIVGLDFSPPPTGYPAGAHYVEGRQEDPDALARACDLGAPFDIIIDDAAHVGTLAKISHGFLYDAHLKPGGHYILEDYGVALTRPEWPDAHPYEPPVDDGNRLPSFEYGMVGLIKQLVDQHLLRRDPIRIDIRPGLTVLHKRARPVAS